MGLDFARGSDLMRRGVRTAVVAAAILLYIGVAHDSLSVGRAQAPAAPAPAAAATRPVSPQKALVDQYCMGCHSDRGKAGGLALSELNLDAVSQHPEIAGVSFVGRFRQWAPLRLSSQAVSGASKL